MWISTKVLQWLISILFLMLHQSLTNQYCNNTSLCRHLLHTFCFSLKKKKHTFIVISKSNRMLFFVFKLVYLLQPPLLDMPAACRHLMMTHHVQWHFAEVRGRQEQSNKWRRRNLMLFNPFPGGRCQFRYRSRCTCAYWMALFAIAESRENTRALY